MKLVETWLNEMSQVIREESLTVPEIRLGVFYTVAQLSSGQTGVAFTPRDLSDTVCCPKSAAEAPPAGRIAGQDAWTLAHYALSPVPLKRAVGVAVLNALSALAMERHGIQGGRVLSGVDALDAAGVQTADRVAMVGAFIPFIKKLKGRVADLWVVDKHLQALKPEELVFWRPPEEVTKILSQATVVVLTGSVLVEGGIDTLLAASSNARKIVMAGPTASAWPQPFFRQGVQVMGGIRVLDGRKLLQLVSEGGSGYFFDTVAEKICIVREDGI